MRKMSLKERKKGRCKNGGNDGERMIEGKGAGKKKRGC